MIGDSAAGEKGPGSDERGLIISADFGTSGVKIAALDRSLSAIATATRRYPLSLPGPDRAEQEPEDWWSALREGIADLAAQIDSEPRDLSEAEWIEFLDVQVDRYGQLRKFFSLGV